MNQAESLRKEILSGPDLSSFARGGKSPDPKLNPGTPTAPSENQLLKNKLLTIIPKLYEKIQVQKHLLELLKHEQIYLKTEIKSDIDEALY